MVSSASAQSFVFKKVVDRNDPIPNAGGALFSIQDPAPALDSRTVVFRNGASSLAPDSVWSVTSDLHLMPGSYTAIVRGANNSTGNALVEFYELP